MTPVQGLGLIGIEHDTGAVEFIDTCSLVLPNPRKIVACFEKTNWSIGPTTTHDVVVVDVVVVVIVVVVVVVIVVVVVVVILCCKPHQRVLNRMSSS